MGIIITILTILDVLIAILIIALVLVQQSKSTGLGTTFGGGGSDTLFGAHAATHLTKLTVIFSTFFLIITLALAILSSHQSNYRQNISAMDPLLTESAPAIPAVAKSAADAKTVKTDTVKQTENKVEKSTAKPVTK
jgi:preprotein translocase subunit SecG